MKNEMKVYWTPVEDALPDDNEVYIVTWETKQYLPRYREFVALCEFVPAEDEDDETGNYWVFTETMKEYPDAEITAWMEVPELYKRAGH